MVTRDGAEDSHVRVPYPRALCKLYKPNLFLQPSVHRRRVPRLPILSKLMGFTMRSTSLLALLRQTKVSPVQASLGSKSDVRVHGRNITYVRIDFCRLIPGTYVSGTLRTYHTYIRIWYIRPRVKKSRRRYFSSNGKSKRKCWYIYQYVSKQYFTLTIYKFPDRLVGGSASAFVSEAAAELKFNRNPAIHPP